MKGITEVFRFIMPDKKLPAEERKQQLIEQMDEFLELEPLKEVMELLHTDLDNFKRDYDGRSKAGGKVVEMQVMNPVEEIEKLREKLYPLLVELGFFHINKPRFESNSRIIVLGGSFNACFKRTRCVAQWKDSSTISVDGLSCYRPINPKERRNSEFTSSAETEFGVLAEAFASTFDLTKDDFEEDFVSDRNLNSVSCIRKYGSSYRIYAAPSGAPELRRADTGDTLKFYKENAGISSDDSILAVTNNIFCNRQLLQLAHFIIEEGLAVDIDVIGYDSGDSIATAESYTPILYVQEIISILDWIDRFKAE